MAPRSSDDAADDRTLADSNDDPVADSNDDPIADSQIAALRSRTPSWAPTALLALVAGGIVLFLATELFPYHSSNHDEGVYLQQAAMLLEGQLRLRPPADPGAVRPWFFVRDGSTLYAKYSPVPPAIFTIGMVFGEPRLSLALVGAGVTAGTVAVASAAFDRRTGLVAGVLLVASPMFLLSTSVFLPYAPTTLLNLGFAVAYVRAARRRSRRWAAAAGVAIGVAFFARPYTAVLFAAPFVVHAAWTALRGVASDGLASPPFQRAVATAVPGAAFVGVTLAYNALLTGDPLMFPYEAFAPLDGLGFGERRILDHSIVYTPELAVRANAHVVYYFATRWIAAGPLAAVAALAGLVAVARRRGFAAPVDDDREDTTSVFDPSLPPATLRLLLVGIAASVVVGNVAFWGNYNVLASFADPTDGLLSLFGPFYHYDLLVPTCAFAAHGVVSRWRRARVEASHWTPVQRRVALAAVLLLVLPVVATAGYAVVDAPIDRNGAATDKHGQVYAPIEATDFDRALVFLPTPYGEWLNHPFQYLRNTPGYDGDVVYVADRGPGDDFAVVDAFPERTPYRFTYRGEWTPTPDRHVTPRLEQLAIREGATVGGRTRVGVPSGSTAATIRLESDDGAVEYAVTEELGERLSLEWQLADRRFQLIDGPERRSLREGGADGVPVAGADELLLRVTFTQPGGAQVSYEQRLTVEVDATTRVVWPPELSVCRLSPDCGREGTYLPAHPEEHLDGVSFDVELSEVEADEEE